MGAHPHAIVSGGSSGIGLALCRRLAADGWDLSLIARTADKLRDAASGLESLHPTQRFEAFPADVADRAQAEASARDAIAALGPPELIIASAGIARPGYFHALPIEVFERTMAVNYFGTLYLVKAALPAMRERGRGHIVMISSGAGLVGLFGYTAYGASKFALRGLAEALRGELRFDGIGVSIAYPPDTDTPQLAAENETKPAETRAISGKARTWSADEVARCILDGVGRRRFCITPGWEMAALAVLHSALAPLLRRYFDRLAAGARGG